MKFPLIIFDMDGTLVQSEDCASQALMDVIPGISDSVSEMTNRYRGMRLARIFADIERRVPGAIPANCLELYRHRENFLASSMIRPSPGACELLSCLECDKCIASNAPVEKTRRSLDICGLSGYFPSAIYSACQVQAWKPDPTLFLHAAAVHGVRPQDCLVLEDSAVGIQAAKAAGMFPVFYDPHFASDPMEDVTRISALPELLALVE